MRIATARATFSVWTVRCMGSCISTDGHAEPNVKPGHNTRITRRPQPACRRGRDCRRRHGHRDTGTRRRPVVDHASDGHRARTRGDALGSGRRRRSDAADTSSGIGRKRSISADSRYTGTDDHAGGADDDDRPDADTGPRARTHGIRHTLGGTGPRARDHIARNGTAPYAGPGSRSHTGAADAVSANEFD